MTNIMVLGSLYNSGIGYLRKTSTWLLAFIQGHGLGFIGLSGSGLGARNTIGV